jgi:hypothetical protein
MLSCPQMRKVARTIIEATLGALPRCRTHRTNVPALTTRLELTKRTIRQEAGTAADRRQRQTGGRRGAIRTMALRSPPASVTYCVTSGVVRSGSRDTSSTQSAITLVRASSIPG